MSPPTMSGVLAVIGAGPAGLAAALEAARSGLKPRVLDQHRQVGGIARTELVRGYRLDIGGHRFFTRVPPIQRLWEEALGPDFRLTRRLSRIFYEGKFYRYPLDLGETLDNLGPWRSLAAVASFARARCRPRGPSETFEQWVTHRFGRYLYETFFRTYTEKVWGISCRELRADWAAQRIRDLSLLTAVRHALWPSRGVGPRSLIDQFHYPRLGPGMMWERLRDQVEQSGGTVQTQQEVTEIHHRSGRVVSLSLRHMDGRTTTLPVAEAISTMALDDLIVRLRPAPPAAVIEAARSLRYRDFVLVGLVLRRPGLFADNWLYVHSPEVLVGRIQNFGAWSADLVPDPQASCLGMEYFCNRGDRVWSMTDGDLIRLAAQELELLGLAPRHCLDWGAVIRQPKAYPVYDPHYQRHLETIRSWLTTLANFQTIGRNGQHRYNNMDHSMLTGVSAVHRVLGEDTDPWAVNVDDSYHEGRAAPKGVGP